MSSSNHDDHDNRGDNSNQGEIIGATLSEKLNNSVRNLATRPENEAVDKFKQFIEESAKVVGDRPLFITDVNVDELFLDLLKKIDAESAANSSNPGKPETSLFRRWNCSSCRSFLSLGGSLAVISKKGKISSPIWSRPYRLLTDVEKKTKPYVRLNDNDDEEDDDDDDDDDASAEIQPEKECKNDSLNKDATSMSVCDEPYARIVKELSNAVKKGGITKHYTTSNVNIGATIKKPFSHLHLTLDKKNKSRIPNESADSRSAQVSEYHRQIIDMIAYFNGRQKLKTTLVELVKALNKQADTFKRPIAHGNWVLTLVEEFNQLAGDAQSNYVWRQASLCPLGYPNWGSSLLNSALKLATKADEGENEGKQEEEEETQLKISYAVNYLKRELDPVRYQRETRQLTESRLLEAAKAFKAMGAESAMARRAITIEDIQEFVWRPPSQCNAAEDVDEGKREKNLDQERPTNDELKAIEENTPCETVSVDYFVDEILPKVQNMWLLVEPTCMSRYLTFFSCAVDPTSVPLLNWDVEDPEDRFDIKKRNTVSQGFYLNPVSFSYETYSDRFNYIAGITTHPAHWHGRQSMNLESKVLLIEGYKVKNVGGLLYKMYINSRFREYAGTIEEITIKTRLQDATESKQEGEQNETTPESKVEDKNDSEIWRKQLKGYVLSGHMEKETSILVQLKDSEGLIKYAHYNVNNVGATEDQAIPK